MKYLRWLLLPFSLLYALVVIIRNWCYDAGWFKSTQFDMPIISVGNLDVGGSGKTPMTEYLIRLLQPGYKVATLSRGYGRKTKGWLLAGDDSTAADIGDEPAQLKHKFPNVTVSVCEDRVAGVRHLLGKQQVILLDDAYQHRALTTGFSILLFDYQQLNGINLLLPAGNRREMYYGRWRADVIIVTKCPADLSEDAMQAMLEKLAPMPDQHVFFSSIQYLDLQDMSQQSANVAVNKNTTVFLLTGIANPAPLHNRLAQAAKHVIPHKYPDHHRFSKKNIAKLAADFEACLTDKKIIITTEKDMQRLQEQELLPYIQQLPIYTLPIGVAFLNNGGQQFDQLIHNYVRKYTAHSGLH